MAERILVSIEDMQAAIQKYNTCKQDQQNAYLQMSNAVRMLDESWDGPASEAFKAAFGAMYKNLETSEQKMQDAIDELKQSAEAFKTAEESEIASGTFGGLEAGESAFS